MMNQIIAMGLQERPEMSPQSQQIGVHHVALYIHPEDFHKTVEVLRRANVTIVRDPVERGGWTVNFLDPDGTQLEFHTGTLPERMKVWT